MRYQTHMLSSFTGAVALSHAVDLPVGLAMTAGVLLGSLLPDIDEPNSFIGRKTSIRVKKGKKEKRIGVSTFIKGIFGHRGFTHSLFATGLVALLLYVWFNPFTLGLVMGYLFHILGDFFSKTGVPLLHPLTKRKFKIYLYTTGKLSENIVFIVILGALVYLGNEHILEWLMWK